MLALQKKINIFLILISSWAFFNPSFGIANELKLSESLVVQLMEIWQSGDDKKLIAIAQTDMVYHDVPNNHHFKGIEESRSYIKHVHNWASDIKIEITKVHHYEQAALAEWTMTGIQSRPIKNRIAIATNNQFTLKGATLIEIENGKIIRAADYIDVLGFVIQLGAEVKLPGGKIISHQKTKE